MEKVTKNEDKLLYDKNLAFFFHIINSLSRESFRRILSNQFIWARLKEYVTNEIEFMFT